jgi:hypothetical protein
MPFGDSERMARAAKNLIQMQRCGLTLDEAVAQADSAKLQRGE